MHTVFFRLFSLLAFTMCVQLSLAQKAPKADKSPVDISYLKAGGETVAKVVYGRPQVNDREIFGKLVKYGKVWRTGANEATEIKFYQEVSIGGQTVAAGTYTLFTIPGEENWTIILNRQLDQWGAYRYDESQDALRIEVPSGEAKNKLESFAIFFDESDSGAELLIGWDMTLIRVPISF